VGEDELRRAIDALEAEKVQDSPAAEAEGVSDTPEVPEVGFGLETDIIEQT
jgi:hypothetical protein